MSQLQTLQEIYSKIASIQEKICLDNSDASLISPPSFYEFNNNLSFGGLFVFDNTQGYEMLNNTLEPFIEAVNEAIGASGLTVEEVELLSETIESQFRIIERVTLPKRLIEEVILKLLIETVLAILLKRFIKGASDCYSNFTEIDDLSGSTTHNLIDHKLIAFDITNYPDTFGRVFSGNDDVPDYLIEPMWVTFFEDSKGWSEPVRIRFLQQRIIVPDCSSKVAVIAPELVDYKLRLYK